MEHIPVDGLLGDSSSPTRSHYDALDLRTDANDDEIVAAYLRSVALTEGSALGGYAMLDPEGRAEVRRELDEARRVLLDPALRAAHDTAIGVDRTRACERVVETPRRDAARDREGHDVAPARLAPVGASDATAPVIPDSGSSGAEGREAGRTSSLPSLRILTPVVGERPAAGDASSSPPVAQGTTTPATAAPATAAPVTTAPVTTSAVASPDEAVRRGQGDVDDAGKGFDARGPSTRAASSSDDASPTDGAALRRLRERQGISVEALAEKTHIRKVFITAIEEMAWGTLPERVFLRGFLTQIARVLRVDAKSVVDGYLAQDPRHRAS